MGPTGSTGPTGTVDITTVVQLAPASQQATNSTNSLINLKLAAPGTSLGTPNTSSLLTLGASGDFPGGTYDGQRFRVDNDGSFVAVGTFDGATDFVSAPVEGAGTRFMWFADKAALRAGGVNGTEWDGTGDNVGNYSVAFGEDTRANGDHAFAMGKVAVSQGPRTTAFGEGVTANGLGSVALGYGASTSSSAGGARAGTFVFSDTSVPVVYSLPSVVDPTSQFHPTVANSFNVRAVNGSYFFTNTALTTGFNFTSTTANLTLTNSKLAMASDGSTTLFSNSSLTAGVVLPGGGGAWQSVSDRNMKENFADIDGEEILRRLRDVPILSWNYKAQNARIRHIGPMAQDFMAAFHVGEDDKHISTIDPDGVALAGVKALDARTTTQQQEIDALRQENADLRQRLERLEKILLDNQKK